MKPENDLERKLAELGEAITSGPSIVDQAAKRIAASSVVPSAHTHRWGRYRAVSLVICLFVCVSTVGLAATETGRNFIRMIITPVKSSYEIQVDLPKRKDPDGTIHRNTYVKWQTEKPFTAEDQEAYRDEVAEIEAIKKAGGGRLAGLGEGITETGEYLIVYMIEYDLSNGEVSRIATGIPTGKQAENMRVDEIIQLRDSGAGEIISQSEYHKGMGLYTIRFTLFDSQTVDLETWFPPSTRAQREAIFAETRDLKAQRRFSVDRAYRDPDGSMHAWFQYELADGQTVIMLEFEIPPDIISPDGKYLVMTETDEAVEIQETTE